MSMAEEQCAHLHPPGTAHLRPVGTVLARPLPQLTMGVAMVEVVTVLDLLLLATVLVRLHLTIEVAAILLVVVMIVHLVLVLLSIVELKRSELVQLPSLLETFLMDLRKEMLLASLNVSDACAKSMSPSIASHAATKGIPSAYILL